MAWTPEDIAKILPVKQVYDDAISPGAKQIGGLIEDTLKTIRVSLFPSTMYGAAHFDEMVAFLEKSVAEVPESNRIAPAPQMLGPILDGVKYEPEGTEIYEMFSRLLSTSMDNARLEEAHPAFPQLIRQLSPDEATVIKEIHESTAAGHPLKRQERHKFLDDGTWIVETIEVETFPTDHLAFPEKLNMYIDHLWFLGIAGIFEAQRQEPLVDNRRQTGNRAFKEYRLTELGKLFAKAVLTPPATV